MDIANALVCPLVSMARIEGRQTASEILADWDVFLPEMSSVPGTTDAYAITTQALYHNTDQPGQRCPRKGVTSAFRRSKTIV